MKQFHFTLKQQMGEASYTIASGGVRSHDIVKAAWRVMRERVPKLHRANSDYPLTLRIEPLKVWTGPTK